MKQVYFPVSDPAAMRDYCKAHGIATPQLYAEQIHGGDYYAATFDVWQQLYCNLPYAVHGCYQL